MKAEIKTQKGIGILQNMTTDNQNIVVLAPKLCLVLSAIMIVTVYILRHTWLVPLFNKVFKGALLININTYLFNEEETRTRTADK